jgi:hypothetical protein
MSLAPMSIDAAPSNACKNVVTFWTYLWVVIHQRQFELIQSTTYLPDVASFDLLFNQRVKFESSRSAAFVGAGRLDDIVAIKSLSRCGDQQFVTQVMDESISFADQARLSTARSTEGKGNRQRCRSRHGLCSL